MESLVYNFYLSVVACTIVRADPSLRYTCMLLDVKQPTNKQTRLEAASNHGSLCWDPNTCWTTCTAVLLSLLPILQLLVMGQLLWQPAQLYYCHYYQYYSCWSWDSYCDNLHSCTTVITTNTTAAGHGTAIVTTCTAVLLSLLPILQLLVMGQLLWQPAQLYYCHYYQYYSCWSWDSYCDNLHSCTTVITTNTTAAGHGTAIVTTCTAVLLSILPILQLLLWQPAQLYYCHYYQYYSCWSWDSYCDNLHSCVTVTTTNTTAAGHRTAIVTTCTAVLLSLLPILQQLVMGQLLW